MNFPYNFADELAVAEKEYNIGGGDTFKFQENDNRLRVLSPGKPVATHRLSQKEYHTCYGKDEGCPYHEDTSPKASVKFAMWILDRKDCKVKLAFMPYTIMKALRDFQNDPEYQFDALPMPYDINVKATKAGTKEVEYSIIAARKSEPLTVDEERAFADKKPVDDIIARMKAKEQNPEVEMEE